ncbi:MAG: hypothetical protein J6M02_03105 [Clostridia bacterium]|nr:hypothetical protein [Clostridia bacterium]
MKEKIFELFGINSIGELKNLISKLKIYLEKGGKRCNYNLAFESAELVID